MLVEGGEQVGEKRTIGFVCYEKRCGGRREIGQGMDFSRREKFGFETDDEQVEAAHITAPGVELTWTDKNHTSR